jgi:hypothetical protein
MNSASVRPHLGLWCLLTVAAVVAAYGAVFRLPLISDDYPVLLIARSYGEPGGWDRLAADALYRCRATFMILTHFMDQWFGLNPLPYNLTGLIMHCVNCLLVLSLGFWGRIGFRLSIPAAIYFAADQSHQEAVLWFSALPDEIVFFFIMASLLVWIRWMERPSSSLYALALVFYLLALASKESGVTAAGLIGLAMLFEGRGVKRTLLATWPFAILALAYFYAGFASRGDHLHYNDGTFRLGPHVISVIGLSIVRLLWPLGLAALAIVAAWSWKRERGTILLAAAWMVLAMVPYGFLTYMPFIPSRHTYIAGVGAALIAAAGFRTLMERVPRPQLVAAACALLFVFGEAMYLGTKKRQQYLKRVAPTENLIEATRTFQGGVVLRCFPFPHVVAEAALKLHYGDRVRLVSSVDDPGSPACEGRADFELVGN